MVNRTSLSHARISLRKSDIPEKSFKRFPREQRDLAVEIPLLLLFYEKARLFLTLVQVLKELGMELGDDAMVIEVKDIKQISARGVVMTPAVVIDGVKAFEGKIPSPEEVKKWIEEKL